MKKILPILLFIILIAPSLSQAWYIEGHCDAVECAICGKTIYVYREASFGPYMPSLIAGGHICPGESACVFFVLTRHLCYDCERKYAKEYSEHIESFYVNRRFENIKLIEAYQEERRQKGVEERKNKIIELEKELKGLRK